MDTKKAEKAIELLLESFGENLQREGLKETPARVARMYEELLSGDKINPDPLLKVFKSEAKDGNIVVIRGIPVCSMCEHHIMPFIGVAHVGYIPVGEEVVGLSKFARVVNIFSRRLQIQERLTDQIAEYIYEKFDAKFVYVMIEAEHTCMTVRGVRALGAKVRTFASRGEDGDKSSVAVEMLRLLLEGK